MIARRFGLLAIVAAVTVVMFPAAPASAYTVIGGSYSGCYGVKRHGYNAAELHVVGLQSGSYAAGYGSIGINARCQGVNAMPFKEIQILQVRLKTGSKTLAKSVSVSTTRNLRVHVRTRMVKVSCSTPMRVYMKVFYNFYNRHYVTPYWIHGPVFYRC